MLGWTLSALAAPGQPSLDLPSPAWTVDLSRICLPSGLQIDIVHRPETGVVAVTTVVGGGHSAETDATRGAAHLVEHLWFESRPDGGPRVWDLEAGLELMASTRDDATVYTTVGGPGDLQALLALEVQRLADPLQGITEERVAAERRVIASELRFRGDHSARAALRWIDGALWPAGHPYAASVTSQQQADRLTLESVRAYVSATYVPEAVSIRLEGAVDPAQVEAALRKVAPASWGEGSHQDCAHPAVKAEPPAPRSAELVPVEAPVWRPQLFLGWSLPPADPRRTARYELAVAVLDEVVRETVGHSRQRGADEVRQGCLLEEGRLASRVVCQIELPDAAAAVQTVAQVRGTLDHQWIPGRSDQRNPAIREAAVAQYLAAFERLDRMDTDHRELRGLDSWRGATDPTADIVDTVFNVTVDELTDLARRYLGPDRMAAVVLVPNDAVAGEGGAASAVEPYTFPEPPGWRVPAPRRKPSAEALPNGVQVWAFQREDAPYLARTTLVAAGGWATSPVSGAADALELVEYPTFDPPWTQVRDKVPHAVWWDYGSRSVAAHTVGPVGALDVAMWTHQHSVDMTVDLEGRQATLDHQLDEVRPMLGKVGGLTIPGLRAQHLLPNDPAAAPWWTRLSEARGVPGGQLVAWQRTVWRPSTSVLVVGSPLDVTRARGAAEKRLAGWKEPKKPLAATSAPLPPPPAARTFAIEGRSVSSTIDVTCRVPARTAANAAAYDVLLPILDRALFNTLREGLGLYVAEVSFSPVDDRVGFLDVTALAPPEHAATAVAEIRAVLAGARDGVADPVLAWGRLSGAGALALTLADSAGSHGWLAAAAREGRPLPDPVALRAAIDAVSAADLSALLADCAGHEAITVMGPAAPGLDAERVDWVARDTAIATSLE